VPTRQYGDDQTGVDLEGLQASLPSGAQRIQHTSAGFVLPSRDVWSHQLKWRSP
jgi:hypothetical protein